MMNVYAIKECYGTKTQTEANRKLRAELCEMNDRAEKFCRDMEMLQRRCEMDEATLETWMEVYDSIRLFDAFKAPEEKASRPAWHKEVTYKMRDRSEPHFRKVCFGDTAEVVKSVETAKAVGAEGTGLVQPHNDLIALSPQIFLRLGHIVEGHACFGEVEQVIGLHVADVADGIGVVHHLRVVGLISLCVCCGAPEGLLFRGEGGLVLAHPLRLVQRLIRPVLRRQLFDASAYVPKSGVLRHLPQQAALALLHIT